MSVTLTEIAKKANVSIATVSYVLNGKAQAQGITEGTAQRILTIAEQEGYLPNKTAQFLRRGRYQLIALIAPHFQDCFLGLLKGIEHEAEKHDYQILLCSTFGDPEREARNIKTLIARRVDGVAIMPVDPRSPHLNYLTRNHVPTVFLQRRFAPPSEVKHMGVDNVAAGRLATRHLLESGCRCVAFGTSEPEASKACSRRRDQDRLAGYREALVEGGLYPAHEVVVELDTGTDAAERVLDALRAHGCDGLVATTDALCKRILGALRHLGKACPEDLRLAGMGDTDLAHLSVPPLTSVAFPEEKMGLDLVRSLIRMIESGTQETDEMLYAPSLVVRASSTAPTGVAVT